MNDRFQDEPRDCNLSALFNPFASHLEAQIEALKGLRVELVRSVEMQQASLNGLLAWQAQLVASQGGRGRGRFMRGGTQWQFQGKRS